MKEFAFSNRDTECIRQDMDGKECSSGHEYTIVDKEDDVPVVHML